MSDQNVTDYEVRIGMLTPDSVYVYSVRTYDETNGYARVVGTFTTARRETSIVTDHLEILVTGDPSLTGEMLVRLGILDAKANDKEVSYATWPADGGNADVPGGTVISGSEFSEIKAVTSDYVRVVLSVEDSDRDDVDELLAQAWDDWFGGGGGLQSGGTTVGAYGGHPGALIDGRNLDGNPVNSANGYYKGEWVREVRDFLNLPQYPGTYTYELKIWSHAVPIFRYEGNLIVQVSASSYSLTQFEWPKDANILLPRWSYMVRSDKISSPFERGGLLLRLGSKGEIFAGRRIKRDQHRWTRLPEVKSQSLIACSSGPNTVTLAAISDTGNLMLAHGTAGSNHALPDFHWVSTDEKCASPVMPVNDGDRLIGFMFVDHDRTVRLLPLNEETVDSKVAPKSINVGRHNATKVWPVYEAGVVHYFALDDRGTLSYHHHSLFPDKTRGEKGTDIGEGVHGFAVAYSRGQAHVFAVSKDRDIRLLSIALHLPSVQTEWRPFGTLDSPGVSPQRG